VQQVVGAPAQTGIEGKALPFGLVRADLMKGDAGMHLARLEAHAAIAGLLDRLPGLRLERAAAPRGLVFRKPPKLHVTWD